MSNWRDKKRRMRRKVHSHFSLPAVVLRDGAETECTVRFHRESQDIGDLPTQEIPYAVRELPTPKIIFDVREYVPARRDVVVLAPGEAYLIDHVDAERDFYVPVEVARLDDADAAGLPAPKV